MLNLWTNRDLIPKDLLFIDGANGFFNGKVEQNKYEDSLSRELMLVIDGVKVKKGNYIETKFGSTDIKNLSSGCKTGLLALEYNGKGCINTECMGENVFDTLCDIVDKNNLTINLFVQRVYGVGLITNRSFRVNGVLYEDEDISDILEDM